MNFTHIALVFRKELLDQLRDRRTLISMVIVPILLFPVLTLGFGALAGRMLERARLEGSTVMLLGAEHAPALAERLRAAEGIVVVAAAADYVDQINNKKLRAAIEFPPGFQEKLQQDSPEALEIKVYYYPGELRSRFALRSLEKIFDEYRDGIVEQRLIARRFAPELLQPFKTKEENVVAPEKVAGTLLGGLIPYLFIILALTGAAYPAMDLAAGEKERGTIETILASPIGRLELVLGKFLMVLLASLTTTLLAILSFASTFWLSRNLVYEALGKRGLEGVPFVISLPGVVAVFFMVLPLAVLFSAALFTMSLLAKSYKEAQTYTQPLILVVLMPAIVALLPGAELNPKLALVPILNVSLVSKEILSGNYPWGLIALIFASSCLYAAAALFIAVRAFQHESVLFRT